MSQLVTNAPEWTPPARCAGEGVTVVHEKFTLLGGAEAVVTGMRAALPGSELCAPLVDQHALPRELRGVDIGTSPLQRLYRGGPEYARFLAALPRAMTRLPVGDARLVVISHYAFANRVVDSLAPGVPTLSYVHTPARWLWDPAFRRVEFSGSGTLRAAALAAFAASQRAADRAAAQRVTRLVANSQYVADRIRRWWGREAAVVHPPVDTGWFHPDPGVQRQPFFLFAGRLVPYKQADVAVKAAQRAGVRLVVVGDGRGMVDVRRAAAAGGNIDILGSVDAVTLRHLMRSCSALVFPGEEDFGIVPVEAQACGTPVVARRAGGALETVREGRTGTFFDGGVDELAEALASFDAADYDPADIRAHAERFSEAAFCAGLRREIAALGVDVGL